MENFEVPSGDQWTTTEKFWKMKYRLHQWRYAFQSSSWRHIKIHFKVELKDYSLEILWYLRRFSFPKLFDRCNKVVTKCLFLECRYLGIRSKIILMYKIMFCNVIRVGIYWRTLTHLANEVLPHNTCKHINRLFWPP